MLRGAQIFSRNSIFNFIIIITLDTPPQRAFISNHNPQTVSWNTGARNGIDELDTEKQLKHGIIPVEKTLFE